MAITIMGGLLVATVLTLLVVPALYALWFRVRSDETVDAFIEHADEAEHFDRRGRADPRRRGMIAIIAEE